MSSHHEHIEKFAKKAEEWDYKLDRLQHRLKDLPEEIKSKAQSSLPSMCPDISAKLPLFRTFSLQHRPISKIIACVSAKNVGGSRYGLYH